MPRRYFTPPGTKSHRVTSLSTPEEELETFKAKQASVDETMLRLRMRLMEMRDGEVKQIRFRLENGKFEVVNKTRWTAEQRRQRDAEKKDQS
jgi:hypothetical protein